MTTGLHPPCKLTPDMESHFRASMSQYSREKNEGGELLNFLMPFLAARYRQATGLSVLELGPRATTAVARALQPHFAIYIGLDHSESCVRKQRENFLLDGIVHAEAVTGNTYSLPFSDNSQDLVIASCHNPVASGTEEELTLAFSEIKRVLKPTGEFLLLPWHESREFSREDLRPGLCLACVPEWIAAMPFRFFDLVESAPSTERYSLPERRLLVLRKK